MPNDEFATMQSRLFVVCSQGRRVKVSWIKDIFKLKALLSNKGHKRNIRWQKKITRGEF